MRQWLSGFREALKPHYNEREIQSLSRLVVEHVTGKSLPALLAEPDSLLTPDQQSKIEEISTRLKQHEPIQYILGETEFYGLRIKVGPGVLIPRGETEELVEWILTAEGRKAERQEGKDEEKRNEGKRTLRVIDIGCGSGAIAIALAKNLPESSVCAGDISESALEFTKSNALLNGVSISAFYLDILNPDTYSFPSCLPAFLPFDLIVSNPPYVASWDKASMQKNVLDYEPHLALFPPGDDPLVFYRAISGFAAANLATGGEVFVEINESIGEETAEIFRRCFKNVELRKDINGKDRMIRAYNG